jgi:serine/threonine protein kinase
MTVMTVEDFCQLLVRSRLHSPDAVSAISQRWQAVALEPSSVEDFRSWLVARELLTEYQLKLLQAGHADHFFLNQYRILERIGKGGTAGVYKALGPQGNLVAIKVLPPSKTKDPAIAGRFRREAQLALQMNHPGVVRTVDFGTSGNLLFLVMEYLNGQTLEDLLRQRPRLRPREAVRIAFLAALGLQHVYERGLVHRDIKPGNFMLCPAPAPQENTLRSMVKILDLGLGRVLFDPGSRQGQDELTGDGSLLGTPDYLAPEQARDPRRVDIRADIYSLGCTLYQALAGEPPFQDTNLVRQILRHATQPPRPLAEFNAAVPPGLEQIIATMLAKDPARRYQTPAEAAEALKGFLASDGQAAAPCVPIRVRR